MANGDDAAAAGMDTLNGTEDRRQGFDEINKTRDYIAQRTSAVQPIAKGGTGATTAAGARTALGITPANIDAAEEDHTHAYNEITAGAINNGGFGLTVGDANITGNLYNPPGRATPVTTSYVAAYLNSDGRLGATPSSIRFKEVLRDYEVPEGFENLRPVVYVLKDDPLRTPRLGLIAEEVNEIEPKLVVHEAGEPFSVHYDRIAVVLLAKIHQLEARLAELEGGADDGAA